MLRHQVSVVIDSALRLGDVAIGHPGFNGLWHREVQRRWPIVLKIVASAEPSRDPMEGRLNTRCN